MDNFYDEHADRGQSSNDYSNISQSKQELLDCIHNLMGVFDTPLARKYIMNDFADEARRIGRAILEKNGINIYNK